MIVAADFVGFSRMMGEDEADTVNAVRKLRSETFDPILAEYGGAILKSMGDGWLMEFSSAAGAVNASMQIQDRMPRHTPIALRIGVNIGDITKTEEDIYGDGINIASRLGWPRYSRQTKPLVQRPRRHQDPCFEQRVD